MKILLLVALILLVSSCATGPAGYWTKEDMNDDQFKEDEFDCDYKSTQMASGERDQIIRAIATYQYFGRCMKSKGYQYIRNP